MSCEGVFFLYCGHVPQLENVPSSDPEARVAPSGENATEFTAPVCPSSVATPVRVATSHSLSVPPSDPEARVAPSGENATEFTAPECPSSVATPVRVATSHSLSVPSSDGRKPG